MNPQLIQIMRAALEEVMAKIPADDSIFGIKAAMAEVILKAAAKVRLVLHTAAQAQPVGEDSCGASKAVGRRLSFHLRPVSRDPSRTGLIVQIRHTVPTNATVLSLQIDQCVVVPLHDRS
jgi:hypothetical protein